MQSLFVRIIIGLAAVVPVAFLVDRFVLPGTLFAGLIGGAAAVVVIAMMQKKQVQ